MRRASATGKSQRQVLEANATVKCHSQVPQSRATVKCHSQVPQSSATVKCRSQVPQSSATFKSRSHGFQSSATFALPGLCSASVLFDSVLHVTVRSHCSNQLFKITVSVSLDLETLYSAAAHSEDRYPRVHSSIYIYIYSSR